MPLKQELDAFGDDELGVRVGLAEPDAAVIVLPPAANRRGRSTGALPATPCATKVISLPSGAPSARVIWATAAGHRDFDGQ